MTEVAITGDELAECRSCGAPIVFALTSSGKRMPVDAVPVAGGNLELNRDAGELGVTVVGAGPEPRHRPHFATCPHADGWRRR